MNKKVTIQGYEGSFHQVAAMHFFGKNVQVITCDTFREVVKIGADKKMSDGAVMAIENSIAGSILPNYNLLLGSKLKVTGEVYLSISQNLLVNKGVQLADIKEVHSHPMALLQCLDYLEKNSWKLVESEDTALSAKHLQQHRSKHVAAVASKLAAELFNLDIIGPDIQTEKNNFTLLLALSILFRLIFLFAIPNLSQDFYRFIWDGRMIFEAINPYESLPETFIKNEAYPINQTIDLYDGMGSLNGSHYTNYPPLNQLSFVIAAIFAKTSILWSVVVMRLQIILADIGIIYIGKKILEKLNMPIHHIFLYALNPFIIIELTGNLHFEAVMLFFLVWSLYLLLQKKWIWSAFIFGLSVSVKLIPLLFIPLFYQ